MIEAMNLAALRDKTLGNGAANASGGTDDSDGLTCEMKIHARDYVTTLLQEKHTMAGSHRVVAKRTDHERPGA